MSRLRASCSHAAPQINATNPRNLMEECQRWLLNLKRGISESLIDTAQDGLAHRRVSRYRENSFRFHFGRTNCFRSRAESEDSDFGRVARASGAAACGRVNHKSGSDDIFTANLILLSCAEISQASDRQVGRITAHSPATNSRESRAVLPPEAKQKFMLLKGWSQPLPARVVRHSPL